MNISFYAYFADLVTHLGAEEAADRVLSTGCTSVEFLEWPRPYQAPQLSTDVQIMALKSALDDRGLSCACYSVGISVMGEDFGEFGNKSGVDVLKRSAEIAVMLGSPYLHHTLTIGYLPPSFGQIPKAEAIKALLPHALAVAEYANALGLTVLYEPQGFFVNGLDGFGLFYSAMKQSGCRIGVCGDMGNSLFVGCNPVSFFEAYAHDICHVHIKDYASETPLRNHQNAPHDRWDTTSDGRYLREARIGSGMVGIDACMDILKKVGYTGAYALESVYPNSTPDNWHLFVSEDRALFAQKYS